jgi:hypothetical protein
MPEVIPPNYRYFTQIVLTRLRQAGCHAPVASTHYRHRFAAAVEKALVRHRREPPEW